MSTANPQSARNDKIRTTVKQFLISFRVKMIGLYLDNNWPLETDVHLIPIGWSFQWQEMLTGWSIVWQRFLNFYESQKQSAAPLVCLVLAEWKGIQAWLRFDTASPFQSAAFHRCHLGQLLLVLMSYTPAPPHPPSAQRRHVLSHLCHIR